MTVLPKNEMLLLPSCYITQYHGSSSVISKLYVFIIFGMVHIRCNFYFYSHQYMFVVTVKSVILLVLFIFRLDLLYRFPIGNESEIQTLMVVFYAVFCCCCFFWVMMIPRSASKSIMGEERWSIGVPGSGPSIHFSQSRCNFTYWINGVPQNI